MRNRRFTFPVLTVFLLAGACGGAQDESAADAAAAGEATGATAQPASMTETPTPEERAAIDQVIAITEKFKDIEAAKTAGYTDQTPTGCLSSAEGAQGIHYLNPTLADAQVELLTPEMVMYEPQADGSMTLVGVDYIIPFDRWTAAEPPTLQGRPLMRNETYSVWALHIWTVRENPNGMFAPWNPNVSCQNAR
ncbi:MAG: hypothetical protein ACREMQ_06755 [Longimicrobiales bacterium]